MSNPWDRQRKDGKLEPARWYSHFVSFLQMGSDRSLLECVNRHRDKIGQKRSNNVPGSWRRASEQWDWRKRAEAWDAAELARREELFRQQCDAWAENRFNDAELIRKKALDLLAFPVSERESVDEQGRKFIIKPLKPTMARTAAAMLKTADELARITTRETLPKTEIELDWRKAAREQGFDPDAILAGLVENIVVQSSDVGSDKSGEDEKG